ncbi:MAG TPA: transposase [Thermoanaerobaculia bacterium]|nr:transposase [Thermoanaerobaculia bacterium]
MSATSRKSSNDWLRSRGPQFASFFWQAGFGAFSVSQSQVEDVRAYIRNQREHHRVKSFQEELRAFLKAYMRSSLTSATCGIESSRGPSGRMTMGPVTQGIGLRPRPWAGLSRPVGPDGPATRVIYLPGLDGQLLRRSVRPYLKRRGGQ